MRHHEASLSQLQTQGRRLEFGATAEGIVKHLAITKQFSEDGVPVD